MIFYEHLQADFYHGLLGDTAIRVIYLQQSEFAFARLRWLIYTSHELIAEVT
jgi:hypothetical protein